MRNSITGSYIRRVVFPAGLLLIFVPVLCQAFPSNRGSLQYNQKRYMSTSGRPRDQIYRYAPNDPHQQESFDSPSTEGANLSIGERIAMLPVEAQSFNQKGKSFYYANGNFFKQDGGGYLVVAAPVGVAIEELPPGCNSLNHQGVSYQYCLGAFYQQIDGGYRVAEAPIGAVVSEIPKNSQTLMENGVNLYTAGGVWYRPFFHNGNVVYKVIPAD